MGDNPSITISYQLNKKKPDFSQIGKFGLFLAAQRERRRRKRAIFFLDE